MARQHKRGRPWRRLLAIALALPVLGCASPLVAPPVASQTATQQRLDDMERRVQQLESRPPVPASFGNREEVQAKITQLQAERGQLLLKYTELHPAIRDIDRKLRVLREQLEMPQP